MIVARAWPEYPPSGRARVDHDGLPRVAVDGYDYRGYAALGDDVIILDWDTAVHREDLHAFADHARRAPHLPLVGPCRLYQDGPVTMPAARWNAKLFHPGMITMRYAERDDPVCHLFGFGMTYVPHALICEFTEANPGKPMDDTSFSGWYYKTTGAETELDWSVSPVHLHYAVPEGGRL